MQNKLLMISLVLAFCCSAAEANEASELATLNMKLKDSGKSLGASFVSIDGKKLPEWPDKISISPGKHTIGYVCVVMVDGPPIPSVTMSFERKKVYDFVCPTNGDLVATVKVDGK